MNRKKKLSLAATAKVLTKQDKNKISDSRIGIKLSDETCYKVSAAFTSLIGVSVIVKNIKNKEEIEYTSLTKAAEAIGISRTAVKKVFDSEKVLKKTYYIRKK